MLSILALDLSCSLTYCFCHSSFCPSLFLPSSLSPWFHLLSVLIIFLFLSCTPSLSPNSSLFSSPHFSLGWFHRDFWNTVLETFWFTTTGLPIVWHLNLFSFIHSDYPTFFIRVRELQKNQSMLESSVFLFVYVFLDALQSVCAYVKILLTISLRNIR